MRDVLSEEPFCLGATAADRRRPRHGRRRTELLGRMARLAGGGWRRYARRHRCLRLLPGVCNDRPQTGRQDMMPRPSLELIASAQVGDAVALASLLAAAQPDIRRYARGTCSAADIDDAVQDALCVLHRHVGSLRAVGAFWGWMFQVVKRECIRLAKRALGKAAPIETIEDETRFAARARQRHRGLAGTLSRSAGTARYRGTDHRRDRHAAHDDARNRQGAAAPRTRTRPRISRSLVVLFRQVRERHEIDALLD